MPMKENPLSFIDPTGLAAYTANRFISTNLVAPGWEYVSHTFTFSTDDNGNVTATYSWGNAANNVGWNLDQPEDIAAAYQALQAGWAQQVGADYMDQFYWQAFNQLNNPANNHGNGWVTNNCKSEAKKLGQLASQLFNTSPLGQSMNWQQTMQAWAQYMANHVSF